MILSRMGWRTGEPDLGDLDRERRNTLAHYTGGSAKYLPHGKLIHILASLTHIIARFWQFATVFSRIGGFFLPSLKIGEFLSQSVFRAKLCARKIGIDSSTQAQETGEVMRRKRRIIGSNYKYASNQKIAAPPAP